MLGWERRNGCFHKLVSNSAQKTVSFSSKKEQKLLLDSMATLSCTACQWVRWADGREKNTLKGGTKWNSKAPVTDNLSEWLIGNKPFLWVLRGTSWKDTRVWKASSLRTTRPHGRVFKEIILSLHPPPNPPQQRHASSRTDISLLSLRMSEDSSTELAPVSISKMSAGLESDTLWAHRWVGQNRETRNKLRHLRPISLQQRRQNYPMQKRQSLW